jgi:hypothetical protein
MLLTINGLRYYDGYKINSNLRYEFNKNNLEKIIAILNQGRKTMTNPTVRSHLFIHH